jgi:hypothetical protein
LSKSERTEIGSGIKVLNIIAMADPLPIAIFSGSIKKYIAAAARSAPNVIIENSFITVLRLMLFIFILRKRICNEHSYYSMKKIFFQEFFNIKRHI